MKKLAWTISYMVVFCLGFIADLALERMGFWDVKIEQKMLGQKIEPVSGVDQFMTLVDLDNGRFSQSSVRVHKGDYLVVTNSDKENQMWLVSTVSAWTTTRGYGEGERMMQTMNEVGVYELRERLSGAVLKVEVYQ